MGGNFHQVWIQILAVLIAYAIAAIGTFVILKILSMFMELRVPSEAEDKGLDIHEHGEGAYGEGGTGELIFASKSSE